MFVGVPGSHSDGARTALLYGFPTVAARKRLPPTLLSLAGRISDNEEDAAQCHRNEKTTNVLFSN